MHALELVAEEGAATVYRGSIAESLLELVSERDGVLTREDLAAYEAAWAEPVEVAYAGARFLTRGGLAGVAPALERLSPLAGLDGTARTLALLDALSGGGPDGHTTNLVTVDGEGSACVLTTSLGLGSGDWVPGLDLHLNSMLGEVDLLVEPLEPGMRMQSMMAPGIALDGEGPTLAIGAAGGTRLRTALVGVASAVLDEGLVAPGGRRPPPRASCRDDGERRAGRRRGRARGARAPRPDGAPLARAAPLLRRRQPRGARGPGGGSSEKRLGAPGVVQ